MKPGIYNMEYDEYHAIDAVRSTQLKPYKVSARRGRHVELNPMTGRHLSLGNAVHTMVLEPDEFDARYVVPGPCQSKLKTGARKGMPCGNAGVVQVDGVWHCAKHAPAEAATETRHLLTPDEGKTCNHIIAALRERPDIKQYLDAPHYVERVLVWKDADTGVLCKCRIDHQLISDAGTIVDLKTTSARDLKPSTLSRTVHDFGYHISLAWYLRGCKALDVPHGDVLLVWLQTVQDNDVAAHWLAEDALEQGDREVTECLSRLVHARETGSYPGVQTDCTNEILHLPEWAQDAPQLIDEGIEIHG